MKEEEKKEEITAKEEEKTDVDSGGADWGYDIPAVTTNSTGGIGW